MTHQGIARQSALCTLWLKTPKRLSVMPSVGSGQRLGRAEACAAACAVRGGCPGAP